MTDFSLVTVWELAAPLQRVWQAIHDVDQWPLWWPYVERVTTLEAGDAGGVGAVRRLRWRTRLPYTITFDTRATLVEPPFALDAEAFGDLHGCGRWRLARQGGVTLVRYVWEVSLAKPWMARIAPLARPVFEWNHNGVMLAGGVGLARWLADQGSLASEPTYSRPG